MWTGFTSIIFSLQTFMLGKMMVEDAGTRSWSSGAGTVAGGCVGDLLSIWVTEHIF